MKFALMVFVLGASVLGVLGGQPIHTSVFACLEDSPVDWMCPVRIFQFLMNSDDVQPHHIRSFAKLMVPMAFDMVDTAQLLSITEDRFLSFLKRFMTNVVLNAVEKEPGRSFSGSMIDLAEVQNLLQGLDLDRKDFAAAAKSSKGDLKSLVTSFQAFIRRAQDDDRMRPVVVAKMKEGLKHDILVSISTLKKQAQVVGKKPKRNAERPPPYVELLKAFEGVKFDVLVDSFSEEVSLQILGVLSSLPQRLVAEL